MAAALLPGIHVFLCVFVYLESCVSLTLTVAGHGVGLCGALVAVLCHHNYRVAYFDFEPCL